jgi:RNA polymerase sigma factor (sigma-70 family)
MSFDNLNSSAFVCRLKSGDPSALSELMKALIPSIRGLLVRDFNLKSQDADEIASDAMYKVYKGVSKFDSARGAKLTTWVTTIAINSAKDWLRKNTKDSKKFLTVAFDGSVGVETFLNAEITTEWFRDSRQPAQEVPISSKLTILANALARLSPEDQNILRQHCVQEYEEIAIDEASKPATIRVRHKRAMDRLRDELEKENNI